VKEILAAGLVVLALGCAQETANIAPAPPEAAAAAERPAWKPPAPPPRPKPCGPGCIEGKGRQTVQFQMAGGDHTASAAVSGNQGIFAIGPPVDISENVTDWSGIRTFFVPEAGVQTLQIRATGKWTLTILKGKQSYVDD